MNNTEKPQKAHKPLIKALERETNIKFPDCLNVIEYKGLVASHMPKCICGALIKYNFEFYNTENRNEFILGSCCVKNIRDDLEYYSENSEEFKEKYIKWKNIFEKIDHVIKSKNIKCKKCEIPWSKPRCFHKGLCKECKNKYKKLLETKILLPKFKNQKLKDIINEKDYMLFCINNKTRQHDLFKEILTY